MPQLHIRLSSTQARQLARQVPSCDVPFMVISYLLQSTCLTSSNCLQLHCWFAYWHMTQPIWHSNCHGGTGGGEGLGGVLGGGGGGLGGGVGGGVGVGDGVGDGEGLGDGGAPPYGTRCSVLAISFGSMNADNSSLPAKPSPRNVPSVAKPTEPESPGCSIGVVTMTSLTFLTKQL